MKGNILQFNRLYVAAWNPVKMSKKKSGLQHRNLVAYQLSGLSECRHHAVAPSVDIGLSFCLRSRNKKTFDVKFIFSALLFHQCIRGFGFLPALSNPTRRISRFPIFLENKLPIGKCGIFSLCQMRSKKELNLSFWERLEMTTRSGVKF